MTEDEWLGLYQSSPRAFPRRCRSREKSPKKSPIYQTRRRSKLKPLFSVPSSTSPEPLVRQSLVAAPMTACLPQPCRPSSPIVHTRCPNAVLPCVSDARNRANAEWSMDFMADTLHQGCRFRTLNILDEGGARSLSDRHRHLHSRHARGAHAGAAGGMAGQTGRDPRR